MWIYLCSLKKYNEGENFGETINLPIEKDELTAIVNKYSFNRQHDIAIHDYELPFSVSEFEDVFNINQVCKFITEERVDPSKITHIEHDKGEDIATLNLETLSDYISDVSSIHATDKKDFCISYYREIEVDLESIPNEIRNATDWDIVFDQLQESLCITQDKENSKYYYTHN